MICVRCKEELEDGFDVCWNCGADLEGNVNPEFQHADAEVRGDYQFEDIFFKKREVRPWFRGDFILPNWSYGILIGLGIIVWTTMFGGEKGGFEYWFPVGIGVTALLASLAWAVAEFKGTNDQPEPIRAIVIGLPSGVSPQAILEFAVEAKSGQVPDGVLVKQLQKAFKVDADTAEQCLAQIQIASSHAMTGEELRFSGQSTLFSTAYNQFRQTPAIANLFLVTG